MLTSALFGVKNIGIFEIYDVSARTRRKGGWDSTDKGERVIFRDFGRTSFMDGP